MNASLLPMQTMDIRRPGFTLVEMLIVIAMIIVLLSLLVVGLGRATKTAQAAKTKGLMTAINQGLVKFREDIGYYPPVLDNGRALLDGPGLGASDYEDVVQEWYSITSLAEYLVGYGNHREDGYGTVPGQPPIFAWESESPAIGLRHPGPDGVWGATRSGDGSLGFRMGGPDDFGSTVNPGPLDQGRVYFPYIELDDDRLLAGIDENGDIRFPGDSQYSADQPKVIVDFWGQPIQYFRRNYPPRALEQSYRPVDRTGDGTPDPVPTLSDVFRLRPFNVTVGAEKDTRFADRSAAGDTTTSFELEAAGFALFSPGPDRVYEADVRADLPGYGGDPEVGDELNRDNIVETGP